MKNNKYISLAVLGSLVLAAPAFAQTKINSSSSIELRDDRGGMMNWGKMMRARSIIRPQPTPLIQGNGQPIVAGAITAINGTTLTITNKSGVTYTVDASNAKVQNKGALSTVSTVAVGDNVVVQGTINGASVAAYSIIDQGPTPSPSVKPNDKKEVRNNFFGGFGKFFQHLFGF